LIKGLEVYFFRTYHPGVGEISHPGFRDISIFPNRIKKDSESRADRRSSAQIRVLGGNMRNLKQHISGEYPRGSSGSRADRNSSAREGY
jgi:hypothetical protein